MPDYKTMYSLLFNEITDVIDRLQKVQQMAEELYINASEPLFIVDHIKNSEQE